MLDSEVYGGYFHIQQEQTPLGDRWNAMHSPHSSPDYGGCTVMNDKPYKNMGDAVEFVKKEFSGQIEDSEIVGWDFQGNRIDVS